MEISLTSAVLQGGSGLTKLIIQTIRGVDIVRVWDQDLLLASVDTQR